MKLLSTIPLAARSPPPPVAKSLHILNTERATSLVPEPQGTEESGAARATEKAADGPSPQFSSGVLPDGSRRAEQASGERSCAGLLLKGSPGLAPTGQVSGPDPVKGNEAPAEEASRVGPSLAVQTEKVVAGIGVCFAGLLKNAKCGFPMQKDSEAAAACEALWFCCVCKDLLVSS